MTGPEALVIWTLAGALVCIALEIIHKDDIWW